VALAAAILLPVPTAAQDLPGDVEISGGTYLYHFQPLDLDGADERTEVYALYLNLDRTAGPWRVHVQGRWRDTRLRPFFPSNVWLQEAWVRYRTPLSGRGGGGGGGSGGESPATSEDGDRPGSVAAPPATLTFRAGKLHQRIGRFWDGSFFGNVHYFDGLKLDPEFGAEAVLEAPLGGAGTTAELYVQGLVDSDRVNGALEGRDLEGEEELEEKGAAVGLRLSASPGELFGRDLRGTVGASGLAERVEAPAGDAASGAGVTLEHVAADLELALAGAGRVYLEWTRRASGGPGTLSDLGPAAAGAGVDVAGSRAAWWLAGVQVRAGRLALRYNVSTGRYDDAGFREWIHQPGLTYRVHESVFLLLEFDDWRREPEGASPVTAAMDDPPAREARIDSSLNAVLHLTF
jgi:hypothetical protein